MKFPTDVPVERGSVGAMGWMGSEFPETFKPYVYRGKGYDIYEQVEPTDYVGKSAPAKPKRKRLTAAQRRRANERRRKTMLAREEAANAAFWERERARIEADKAEIARLDAKATWGAMKPERDEARRRAYTIRSAPGWKPMAGDDIERLLGEL